jgi:hypothetical protein
MYSPVIAINSGATFNGNCEMKPRETGLPKITEAPIKLPLPEKG